MVFHIHDEVVIDTAAFDTNDAMLDKVVKIMSTPIPWAEGLPSALTAGSEHFFKKIKEATFYVYQDFYYQRNHMGRAEGGGR
ncbi:MAG: hypothetical protein ACLRR6_02250 [Oscillospiraceae bacterium]